MVQIAVITPQGLSKHLGRVWNAPDTAADIAADPDLYYVDAVALAARNRVEPPTLDQWRLICGGSVLVA